MNDIVNDTPSDEELVGRQLGRRPQGFLRVATRCPLGLPETIVTKPLIPTAPTRSGEARVKPFPTAFWLVCPGAVRAVAELEARGWVRVLQERLARDDAAREAQREAARSYAAFRRALLSDDEAAWLKANHPSQYDVIARSGVGGVLGDGGIKCLHAHYADYLARGANPVGRWVRELLTEQARSRGH